MVTPLRVRLPLAIPLAMLLVGTLPAQSLTVARPTLVVGEHCEVAFSGSTSARDWIGIDAATATPQPGNPGPYWLYTNGRRTGTGAVIPSGGLRFLPFSLPPGSYVARLFANDGYAVLASAAFTIESGSARPAPAPRGELTVMSFNVWVSARGPGGLQAVADRIAETGADLVGLQEIDAASTAALTALLAQRPGYGQVQGAWLTNDDAVISRFPILRRYVVPGLRGSGVKVALPSGHALRFFDSHLTAYPYGPYSLRDGGTVSQALADEARTRLTEIGQVLTRLVDDPSMDPQLETILVGDHNAPSHLDWTATNAAQNFGLAVAWPVSLALVAAGFDDAYRLVHPDPRAARALTWSPGYPKGTLQLDDVHDRIDMVYHRAPTSGPRLRGSQAHTYDADPWPADHRAVVVSFARDGAASFVGFGTGCAGSAGTPILTGLLQSVPRLGSTFTVVVSGAPVGAVVWRNLGLSDHRWGGVALPFDLTPLGMPGCHVWCSIEGATSVTTSGGAVLWSLAIPSDVGLLGARFHQQALVVDPAANAAGVTATNGGTATIGW